MNAKARQGEKGGDHTRWTESGQERTPIALPCLWFEQVDKDGLQHLPHADRIGMKYSPGIKKCQRGTDVPTGASTKFFGENGFTKSQHVVSNMWIAPYKWSIPSKQNIEKAIPGTGTGPLRFTLGTTLR